MSMGWNVWRERVREAFWIVPAACVSAAGLLAVGLLELDEVLSREGSALAFTGGPSSARGLLDSIASSLLTLTALVFSITLVVLQLTSSQFSPRVLRTFLHDRQNQVTLGVFTGTYVYALVTLRAVRGDDGITDQFVPGITISVAFGLTVVCVGLLVAYIHHITQSIRVVNIMAIITGETEEAIEGQHPIDYKPVALPALSDGDPQVITAERFGVVTVVEEARLVELATRADCQLWLVPRVGDFVPRGAPLLLVFGGGLNDGGEDGHVLDEDDVRDSVRLDRERSVQQDVAFGLRQLVDIAERALSPGVNDPTTAVQCLDQIHHLLRQLASRPYPTGVHVDDTGRVRLVVPQPEWGDHVALALDEIRHWGADSLQVHRRLRSLVADLLDVVSAKRRPALTRQLELLDARIQDLPPAERVLALQAGRAGTSEQ